MVLLGEDSASRKLKFCASVSPDVQEFGIIILYGCVHTFRLDFLKELGLSNLLMKKIAHKLNRHTAVVRSATIADIAGMIQLLQELFAIESDFTPNVRLQRQGLATLIESEGATILVAEVKKQVIGMCTLQPLISTAEGGVVGIVEDLVVTEAYRGMGVGSVLLAAIEDVAQQQDMSRLQLLTDFDDKKVDHFYETHQWQHTKLMTMRKKFD